jgi:hypothetical protein
MVAEFDGSGFRFKYPDNWRLEREEDEAGFTVSVQSPETAFFMLCLRRDNPKTEDVADMALEALREEYPGLEADDCIDAVAGQPAIGHNIQFFSLDLTNTCWTRCFYTGRGTVLLLSQFNDLEMEKNEPVLRAICASLKLDDD